jgi:hypothetical protein
MQINKMAKELNNAKYPDKQISFEKKIGHIVNS